MRRGAIYRVDSGCQFPLYLLHLNIFIYLDISEYNIRDATFYNVPRQCQYICMILMLVPSLASSQFFFFFKYIFPLVNGVCLLRINHIHILYELRMPYREWYGWIPSYIWLTVCCVALTYVRCTTAHMCIYIYRYGIQGYVSILCLGFIFDLYANVMASFPFAHIYTHTYHKWNSITTDWFLCCFSLYVHTLFNSSG